MTSLERCLMTLTRVLSELKIPYAVMGGLAVRVYAIPRFTNDVDLTISVDREQLPTLFDALEFRKSMESQKSSFRRSEDCRRVVGSRSGSGDRCGEGFASCHGGKSGLHRTRWWVTPTVRKDRDSATESIPPIIEVLPGVRSWKAAMR